MREREREREGERERDRLIDKQLIEECYGQIQRERNYITESMSDRHRKSYEVMYLSKKFYILWRSLKQHFTLAPGQR